MRKTLHSTRSPNPAEPGMAPRLRGNPIEANRGQRRTWPARALGRLVSRRPSRGQALVEFALISIVMLLMLATVVDFGRLFYTQITVENAARAGALVAARDPSSYTGACPPPPADTNRIGCAIAAESRGSGVTVNASEVAVTCEDMAGNAVGCSSSPQAATRSRVSVDKAFGFLMPILSGFLGSSITVSASVAADQQSLPPAATFIPVPSATPAPTASPTPTPTAAPTATATATPSPTPTPTPTPRPCVTGEAVVPDLVIGATPGSTETVAEARAEWLTAGFSLSNFSPSNGSNTKIVETQSNDGDVGLCKPVGTYTVTVTHS